MGLVSTWLNGIGLSSAVPTFQAAGIVTPAALAELDVAHFEALGISDPDDRRKLFYLVQRIKMAVSKDHKKSAEEQVDAVLSGTAVDNDPLINHDLSEKKEDKPAPHSSPPRTSRKKVAAQPSSSVPVASPTSALSEPPRRSRRLASKVEETPVSSAHGSSAKENRSLQSSPQKATARSVKGISAPAAPYFRTSSPTKVAKASSTSGRTAVASPRAVKKPAPQNRTTRPKPFEQTASDHEEDDDSEWEAPEEEDDDDDDDDDFELENDEVDVLTAKPTTCRLSNARRTSTCESSRSSKAKSVFNLQDDDESEPKANSRSSSRKKSGLKKPQPVTASTNETEGSKPSASKLQAPTSKSKDAAAGKRPESKLQNPGRSMRTGKRLSVIPAETIAPMSPLVDNPKSPPKYEEDEPSKRAIRSRKASQHRRNGSSDSCNSNKLASLLESSASDIEGDALSVASESDSIKSISKLNNSRPKSMEPSELGSVINKNRRIAPPAARRASSKSDLSASSSSSLNRRKSGSVLNSSSSSVSDTTANRSSSKGVAFVHGGTTAESWATKVGYLREDNDSEHELFRDGEDQQLFEYDMRIRVIVRKRPLNKAEANISGGVDVIHPLDYGEYGRVLVYQPKTRVDLTKEIETVPFAYDNIYDESSTNNQIYQRSLRNLIQPFFQGQWSTIFAYGQTGSGKTYTMMGSNMTGINSGTATNDEANFGLYYLAALDIFDMVKRPEYRHLNVQVSLFEIYGGKLFDLLNARKQVKCLEDSKGKVCFPGLTEHPVSGPDDLMQLIEEGSTNRSTGTTSRNADSSRSHAVLQLKLRKDAGRRKNVEHGRLNFIDLAGSERGADTSSSSRATRLEGAEINTSLLALKEVIRALATGGSMTHIPFRGSKLTQVLKDSFVGENSRCCMVACISPDISNCEQTLNTLRYADRVKERHSESGALSNGYEEPTRLNPLEIKTQFQSTEALVYDHDESSPNMIRGSSRDASEGGDSESSSPRFQSDRDAAALDDLLSASLHEPPHIIREPASPASLTNKHRVGEALVAAHRSVMSKMLSMVKNEMTLVNKVDADRDGLDDYLVELETMQNTQLDLISKLRRSLNKYVTACEAPSGSSTVQVESDDESFEDLRDL